MGIRLNKHGGRRQGAGRKPSPFLPGLVRVAFRDETERDAYMSISPRQRVLLALAAERCKECEEILDMLPKGERICNRCS